MTDESAKAKDRPATFEANAYTNSTPLLDANGAAELLSVPVSWIRQETRAERLPHIRLGRYRRYDCAELLKWAAGRARGPRPTGTHPVSRERKPQL